MVRDPRLRRARSGGGPRLEPAAGVRPAGGASGLHEAPHADPHAPLRIRPTDRVAVFGATYSGKSALINAIASRWDRRLVYEPKGNPSDRLPNTVLARDGAAAAAALPGCVQYTPWSIRDIKRDFDAPVGRVLELRGHAIVVHEGFDLGSNDDGPPEENLARAVYQGAGMGIPMIYAFQDPIGLWRKWFTQASIVVVFYLQSDDHRALLARHLGPARLREPVPFDHSFLVWRRDDPDRVLHLPPLVLPRPAPVV